MVQVTGNAGTYVSALHETAVPEVVKYHPREPRPRFDPAAALAAWDAVKPREETAPAAPALRAKRPCKNCGRDPWDLIQGLCAECADKAASYTPPPVTAFEPADLTPFVEAVDQSVAELAEVYERPTAPPPTVVEDVNVTPPPLSGPAEGIEERPKSVILSTETSPQTGPTVLEPAVVKPAAASSTTSTSDRAVEQMLAEFSRLGHQVLRDVRASAERLDGLLNIMDRFLGTPAAPQPAKARPKLSRTSSVDTASIVDAYTGGKTLQETAEATGHTLPTVRRHLDLAGVERRDDRKTKSGGRNKILADNPIVVANIRRLYVDRGMSQGQVAERLGLTQRVVFSIMQRNGIKARSANTQAPPLDGAVQLRDRIAALGTTSTALRAWAAECAIPCPRTGMVPAAVVNAWEASR